MTVPPSLRAEDEDRGDANRAGVERRPHSFRSALGHVLACFLVAAALQPLWPRAAGRYTALVAAAAQPILLWLQPTPLVSGLSTRGTVVRIESAGSPEAPVGSFETGHFSFYMPFVVLLLCTARWRLRLVTLPEIGLILALLLAIQVSCVSFGALRVAAFGPLTGGGYGIIGPLEYVLLHTLYHTYGNFGPQLWNGLIVALVLFRAGRLKDPSLPRRPAATSGGLAAACGVLILPSVLFIVAAPAVRHLTGQATLARRTTAAAFFREGNPEAAARLARDILDEDENDLRAMMILGSIAEGGSPSEAKTWYARVVGREPGHVAARLGLARAEERLGHLDAAVTEFYNVLRLAPDRADAFEDLGDIYMQRREYAAAREHYGAAASLQPDRAGLMLKIARAAEPVSDAD